MKEKAVFSTVDAYISGSVEAGLFHIMGNPVPGISLEQAEEAIRQELELLKNEPIAEEELEKVKNKYESNFIFANINYLDLATNLAYFELIGKAEDINTEVDKYRAVSASQIMRVAKETFVRENSSTLYYIAKKNT